MNWFRRHFTGLRRWLILSYSAVTVAFLVMLMLAVAGLRLLTQNSATSQPQPWNNLYLFICLLMLPMGMIGIVSGVLISGDITRRLHYLAQAAESWSQGQFHIQVRDRAHDELGRLARDLNSMAEQLQKLLLTRQGLAVLEERQRLGRDLHDSIKQQLFVITMLVGTARAQISDQHQIKHILSEAERLAGQVHTELTALIYALRPVELASKGLKEALGEFVETWSRSTDITAQIHFADELLISLTAEQALFRIAQEALSNVARHSGATYVEVRLSREPRIVLLSVRDNGHGFDTASKVGWGIGLRSMHERVEALEGTLSIASNAKGTWLEARLPRSGEVHSGIQGQVMPEPMRETVRKDDERERQ